jgi:dCTP deaminase
MILSDFILEKLGEDIVKPFDSTKQSSDKGLSWGLTSYGYDIRLSPKEMYVVLKSPIQDEIDPKNFNKDDIGDYQELIEDENGSYFYLPPHAHGLGVSLEYLTIPRQCLAFTLNKSTYIRSGLQIQTTVLEPEWEGYLTLELFNTTPYYLRVYANEGICQLVYLTGKKPCLNSYQDHKGKYQYQENNIIFPK